MLQGKINIIKQSSKQLMIPFIFFPSFVWLHHEAYGNLSSPTRIKPMSAAVEAEPSRRSLHLPFNIFLLIAKKQIYFHLKHNSQD